MKRPAKRAGACEGESGDARGVDDAVVPILVLVRMFPSIVQPYVQSHLQVLSNLGFDVSICAQTDPRDELVHPDVQRFGWLDRCRYVDLDRAGLAGSFMRAPLLDVRYWRRVLRIGRHGYGLVQFLKSAAGAQVLSRRPAIVHSHDIFQTYYFLFLREVFGIPLVMTFHGREPADVVPLERSKQAEVFRACSAIIVNTEFARGQLLDEGCDPEKIAIIPQPTDLSGRDFRERSSTPNGPPRLLSVGRFSHEKGFHIAIEAIARLRDQGMETVYHIVGDGLERTALEALVERLDLAESVRFEGRVSSETLNALYAQADLMLVPSIHPEDDSHTETQGVVIQEAQGSGLPVVASRAGGIPEVIVDGHDGVLVAPDNADALAEGVRRALAEDGFYASLSREGRATVEDRFSLDMVGRELAGIYSDVLEREQVR